MTIFTKVALGLTLLSSGLLAVEPASSRNSKDTLSRRLKNLQNVLENVTCPDPRHEKFTGVAKTFDPKYLGANYFCRDVQQAYPSRREGLIISALNKTKDVIKKKDPVIIAGFAGLCPEAVFLGTIYPNAVTVCNDVSTGRLKYGETVHAYLKANTGLHPIMYSGENFKDLNQELIAGGINQPDLLILPSPKMNYPGFEQFDLAKTIQEMKPRAVLLWTQLPEELKYYKKKFSSKAFQKMYDLKLFQDTTYGIPDYVHPTDGISFTNKNEWLMLMLKSRSGDQSVEQCIANSCKEK